MRKSTKYIAMAVAVVLVTGLMAIGIWAATAGSAGINANVSWSAAKGIQLTLDCQVVNNPDGTGVGITGQGETSEPNRIPQQVIDASTSNQRSALTGTLNAQFYDADAGTADDDGVNNPSPIVYTYTIVNTGSTIIGVTVTKAPTEAAESGTTEDTHKPRVTLNASYEGENFTSSTVSAIAGSGFNLPVGGTLTYTITLSMASGSSDVTDADLGISSFDAGVAFNFTVGESLGVYVNGVSQNLGNVSSTATIGTFVEELDTKTYPGYFYDAELTVPVVEADHDVVISPNSCITLYTKPATLEKIEFVSYGDGTCGFREPDPESRVSGEVIIPSVSPAGDTVICPWTGYDEEYYPDNPWTGYNWNSDITKVILPNTIIHLKTEYDSGDGCFNYCTGLQSVTLQEGLTEISTSSFTGCSSLTSISIPDSVTKIDYLSLGECENLKSIVIGKGVTSIDSWAFMGTVLEKISVHAENTKFDTRDNCNALIESSSDTLVLGLSTSYIPSSVKAIGAGAFEACGENLTKIRIPNSVTTIGDSAFSYTGLTSITLHNNITEIGESAFAYTPITALTIPTSLTSISNSAFAGTSLNSINIPNNITSIGNSAFKEASITNLTFSERTSDLTIGREAFYGTLITNLVLPEGVTSIGADSFRNYGSKLKTIKLPSTLISIGSQAFAPYTDDNSVISIDIADNNPVYNDGNGSNVIISGTTLIFGAGIIESIPEGVTTISSYALMGFNGSSVTLPTTLKTIGTDSFSWSWGLKSINIPEGVTSIGEDAFYQCWYLETVALPSTLTSIGEGGFYSCKKLTSITVPAGVTKLANETFYNCESLTSLEILGDITSIGYTAFKNCTKLTKFYIPSTVTTISSPTNWSYAPFCGCKSTLKIYCGASAKQSGWGTYWNYYASGKTLSVTYNTTRDAYNAL